MLGKSGEFKTLAACGTSTAGMLPAYLVRQETVVQHDRLIVCG